MPCSRPTAKTVWIFLKTFLDFCPCWEICGFDLFLKLLCYTVGTLLARNHESFGGLFNICVWPLIPGSWSSLGKVQGDSF